MVGVEGELRLVGLFLPQPEEVVDPALAVGPADPAVGRPKAEFGGLRLRLDSVERAEECLHVDTVSSLCCGHLGLVPSSKSVDRPMTALMVCRSLHGPLLLAR